jgi:translation elongation factor EF-Tu-like GTPase
MEFFSTVESTFSVAGRGLVIVPEVPQGDFRIRAGTKIQLRTPDGRLLDSHITGVEFLKEALAAPCRMAILITRDIGRDDVPVGTEIWYFRETAALAKSPDAQPC